MKSLNKLRKKYITNHPVYCKYLESRSLAADTVNKHEEYKPELVTDRN